jgi:hypothetical protein
VLKVFGSGHPGLQDGVGTSAQFSTPQGIVYGSETLYVADTENHLLRKVAMVVMCALAGVMPKSFCRLIWPQGLFPL